MGLKPCRNHIVKMRILMAEICATSTSRNHENRQNRQKGWREMISEDFRGFHKRFRGGLKPLLSDFKVRFRVSVV